MSARVIVFGGTFDPVHNGHIAIAGQAVALTGFDVLWFVPAAIPPLRDPPVAPPAQRLAMLHAAVAGDPRFAVLDVEVTRGGVSYTADTMDALCALHPGTELAVLVGADAARSIRAWHRGADLLARERFVIVNRTGVAPLRDVELEKLGYDRSRVTLLEVDSPAISASAVRRRAAAGQDIGPLVPAPVRSMIEASGVYRSGRAVHNAGG